jgi:hypothetical protein
MAAATQRCPNLAIAGSGAPLGLAIVDGLGLTAPSTEGPALSRRRLDALATRELPFEWVHMGTSLCTVATLESVIRQHPTIAPPRSGHVGNWTDIADGRSGAIDYNKIICQQTALGVPLIYEFTMTEDEGLQNGDSIYLPGSYVCGGRRDILPLYSWNGSDFMLRDRATPRLLPFVLTPDHGRLASLVAYHQLRNANLSDYRFRSQAGLILENESRLRDILLSLIASAFRQPEPGKALGLVFDRIAWCDGSVRRASWSVQGAACQSGTAAFADARALVEAALLSFVAATEPDTVVAEISRFERPMPLCSSPLVSLLLAVFNSHFQPGHVPAAHELLPFNVHMHWGAIGMAGYPPRRSGHFADHARYSRKLYQTVMGEFHDLAPIYFVLLPAAIYLLWPQEHCPNDVELVAALIREVRLTTDPLVEKTNILPDEVGRVVQRWLERERHNLSEYFLNRFVSRRSVFNDIELPPPGQSIRPPGFDDLTLRQASMLIGALFDHAA